MKQWNSLNISVDYWAMDPGIRSFSSERTDVARADVQPGKAIPYRDPSGLLDPLKAVEVGEDYLTLLVGTRERTLHTGEHGTFDKCGRDYTNFELCLSLEP